ncbi:MAG: ATP-binding cassette domain-containing protein [Anaerolineales bacterium]|nr:ATP-binding cassette domain-containing protein [Anaerolineales bacterium]
MMNRPLVIENLTFKYRTRPELALEDVSLELKQGELLLIAGSSGCGKTTLARCINGLIPRSYRGERTGKVLLHGKEVAEMQIPRSLRLWGRYCKTLSVRSLRVMSITRSHLVLRIWECRVQRSCCAWIRH